jgi:exo beta-1,2-glucooligosaccharide sophorohydrolase (non-reducing end)
MQSKSCKIFGLLICIVASFAVQAQEKNYPFDFFSNGNMPGNYYYSSVWQSGSALVENQGNKLPLNEKIIHTPGNALKISYQNSPSGEWRAAIYHPGFWDKEDYFPGIRGVDHYNQAMFLSAWIYLPQKIEQEEMPVIRLMYKDSSLSQTFPVVVSKTNQWVRILIPTSGLKNFNPTKPENILAIVFSQSLKKQSNQQTIYVDDIEFVPKENAAALQTPATIKTAVGYARHVDLEWNNIIDENIRYVKIYRSQNGKDYKAIAVQ